MALGYYGIDVTEDEFRNRADELAPGQWNYVHAVYKAMNWFLSSNGLYMTYQWKNIESLSEDDFKNLAVKNIMGNRPMIALVTINNTSYFNYTTAGHYMVLRGISFIPNGRYYKTVINDPYPGKASVHYNVPLSTLQSYICAHSNCPIIYVID